MPRVDIDFTKASASGLTILPADTYTFEIGEPKAFARQGQNGENYGVQFPLKVVGGEKDGKRVFMSGFMHTEGSLGMTKRFIMTALGYNPRTQEAEFNEKYASADWSLDTDAKTCGSIYHELTGKLIIGELDVRMDNKGQEQQNFKSWLVYGG